MVLLRNLAEIRERRRGKATAAAADDSQPAADQEASSANWSTGRLLDSGLLALTTVAGRYRIAADPFQMAHDLGLGTRAATGEDIARAASRIGLRSRLRRGQSSARLRSVPMPAIARMRNGTYRILVSHLPDDQMRIADPITRSVQALTLEQFSVDWDGELILITRRWGGAGADPATFGFRWFSTSIWRYRKPLAHVMIASLFVQLFALVTPLFFQIVVDKVLVHRSFSTLLVIVVGLAGIGLFDVTLQFLRSYALSHTTSRIDVELGSRLFDHLLRLPLSFFEMRPAGQIVARVRELETIRNFLTGRGLSSVIDLLFTIIFVVVLFIYSTTLALIVLASLPIYFLIAVFVRPALRDKLNERFNTAAASQQFLVESIFGIQTLKAAAVEPILRNEWEDRLAAYVRASFQAVTLSNFGQNAITYVNKATTAAVLFFGAQAVINTELTVGELIAFYMIMNQTTAPILRLSQLWQDFQQVQISVQRLGDVLNAHPESQRLGVANLPPVRGEITIDDVTFRYQPDTQEVIKRLSLHIPAGQVLGIVGPSGSGKSTLTKLIQRLYRPDSGQILVDGMNIDQVDTAWLRRQIGVVLQENTLFNRSIHENIALANPGMSRAQVIAVARLSGADEFIRKLPLGYDTRIEERGANLSGGQRQRIAIARALATDPRILIFDEATSALDYESERTIQSNMREIARGRTVLIIAHRLVAVRDADRIIAIDEGIIVEEGTHDELLSQSDSIYGKLWRMQARGSGN